MEGGKGEEGEEEAEKEGEKGEWEAGEEGCSPSPGKLEGGQPEDRLQGGYKRQHRDAEGPAGSAQPRHAPWLEAQRIPSPTAEAAQQERGHRQPCPGELGAGAAEDGAQPMSCPPPPPEGKIPKVLFSPKGPFAPSLSPVRPAPSAFSAVTFQFL